MASSPGSSSGNLFARPWFVAPTLARALPRGRRVARRVDGCGDLADAGLARRRSQGRSAPRGSPSSCSVNPLAWTHTATLALPRPALLAGVAPPGPLVASFALLSVPRQTLPGPGRASSSSWARRRRRLLLAPRRGAPRHRRDGAAMRPLEPLVEDARVKGLSFHRMVVGLLFASIFLTACLMPAQSDTLLALCARARRSGTRIQVPLVDTFPRTRPRGGSGRTTRASAGSCPTRSIGWAACRCSRAPPRSSSRRRSRCRIG